MSKKEKILLFILAAINFTNIMDFMIMMPLQEYLVPSFHIDPKQFSFLVSAYAFSAGISSLTASFFIDRFDRKVALLFAYLGFIIGTLACGLAPTYPLMMMARVVAGVFGGLIGAQGLAIVGDTIPFERRGAAMGILMSAFALASIIGVPVGLFLASNFGWHIPFLVIVGLGIIIWPLAAMNVPSLKGHIGIDRKENGRFGIYKGILSNRNQQMGLLMMFTLILSHFSIIPFIAPYLENNVGFSKNQIALMYFIGGCVSLISSPIIGKLSDRYGKFKILGIFLILSVIPVYLITNMPRIPYYYVLIVTAIFFLFAGGRMVPAQALITSVVNPQQRGGFMNINSSLTQLGTGIAAMMAGMIVTKNTANELVHYQYVGYIGMAISFVCFFVAMQVKPIDMNKPPVDVLK